MSVLLVAEQLRREVPGGIGTYILGLLRGLAALGPDAPDVTLHASRPPSRPDPLSAHGLPVVSSRLPGPLLVAAWDRGLVGPPTGFPVVHASSLATPPARGMALVVTVHDLAWREVPDTFPARGRRWHEAALGRAQERARLFIVPSRRTADALVAAGADVRRVEVVEEGCDHLPPADAAGADALLARHGVRGGYLLAVGTLEPRKNLARLVEAYALARPRLPEPWPLVVAGPAGWDGSAAAGDRGRGAPSPPDGVVLLGPVAGAVLAGLYRRARCLAYVPLVEGFGLPAVEAMHACTPVVVSAVPSVGSAGLQVDPLDVAVIAEALLTAAADDRARAELVTGGLLRARELTWEATAHRHVELWRALA